MHIIINEHQHKIIEGNVTTQQMRDRIKRVNSDKKELEDYIESRGEYMTDITNGKTYLVQYLKALSDLVGKQYAVCAPVRHDGTYGAFYVKPFDTFKKIDRTNNRNKDNKQTHIKQNLYQMLGYNK